jgi:energy-converting hydrogenase Eha subunit H
MDGLDVAHLDRMLRGESEVAPWFAAEVERFRTQGAIAE